MQRPLLPQLWGNKVNQITAYSNTKKHAWVLIHVESELRKKEDASFQLPTFDDIYEIEAPKEPIV